MASDLHTTIQRISEKSRFLTERYMTVLQQRDEALGRIAELEQALRERDHKIQMLNTEVEYLKVTSALAPTAETVEATRAVIRELIRDIDRCITDLND